MINQAAIIAALGSRAVWTPDKWGTDRLVDYTADDVLTSGGLVTTLVDQRGVANATQGNGANQGALIASHAALGGKAAVRFIDTKFYDIPALASTGTSHGTWSLLDNQNAATTGQYITFFGASTFGIRLVSGAGDTAIYDGALRTFPAGSMPAGGQSVLWDSVGAFASLYRGGSMVGVPLACTARAYVSAGTVSSLGPTSDMENCYIRRLLLLDRASTADDRTKWFTYTVSDAGV